MKRKLMTSSIVVAVLAAYVIAARWLGIALRLEGERPAIFDDHFDLFSPGRPNSQVRSARNDLSADWKSSFNHRRHKGNLCKQSTKTRQTRSQTASTGA